VQATRFVESYFDAWNHRDPKGVADHLAAGGIYFDIPENEQRSHDELITSLTDFFVHHRQKYELIGDILTGRDSIAFQYRVSPTGECNADAENDAQSGSYSGAEFMASSGDAAIVITDYYDIPGMVQPGSIAHVTANRSLAIKYAKSGLSSAQLDELKCRLETIMQAEKVFLQSDLTLPKLAAIVDCSVNHLSQVINAGFGVSFFDYLNQHRIEYAKKQLRDYDGPNSAILNVAFAAGFNSNSAFYAAFKKCIGQTPAQYRKAQSA
jgi:AraC-like DNA-binding protein